ncbi:MAG: catalase, partial [Desulfobulbaceae bacterium]|nr:catalase [Desulfobulbaceae bacterium]
ELKQRDREVRAHEQAHLANAGQYAGGPSYSYQQGPDGKRYAVGGEVPIDVSKKRTPEQTIQKMRTVRRAALAPANPSSADRSIAASASRKEAEARRELQNEKTGTDAQQSAKDADSSNRNTVAPENEIDESSRMTRSQIRAVAA